MPFNVNLSSSIREKFQPVFGLEDVLIGILAWKAKVQCSFIDPWKVLLQN
jgi:hypothetical protein